MTVQRNAIANIAGRGWSAVMNFAFVPVYIRFMGIEAYGLIGFFVSLMAVFFFLDMGLSTTINRELARIEPTEAGRIGARTLMRTLETIYWAIGAVICVAIVLLGPWIARWWLHPTSISTADTVRAIRLMGVVALFRWPIPLYSGALMGMQRQVRLNVATSIGATLQAGGAALVLWLIAPTILAFFLWQAIASLVQIVLLAVLFWRAIAQAGHRPRFAGKSLAGIAGFSMGVTGITVLSVVLTQSDKFLLSKILPLDQFGYYALAGSIASVLTIAASAVYGAIFPAFSQIVATGTERQLSLLYHKSSQLLSILLFPAGITLTMFSHELLRGFVGNAAIAERAYPLLSLLALGNLLLSMMLLPLALQLANGWTRLSLVKNLVAVVIFVPALWVMVHQFGAIGAGIVWIGLTVGYLTIEVPIMHRRLLPNDKWRWYGVDLGLPAVISCIIIGGARLVVDPGMDVVPALCIIVAAAALALAACAAASPAIRDWLRDRRARPLEMVDAGGR